MYKTIPVAGGYQIFWQKPNGHRHVAEIKVYDHKSNADRRKKQLNGMVIGECDRCGEPGTHQDDAGRAICADCWLRLYDPASIEEPPNNREPLDAHLSAYVRKTTLQSLYSWCEAHNASTNVAVEFMISNELDIWKRGA